MKHIFWGRLFIPLIFGCLLFSPSWSAAAEISGTVFLPAGDTAPTKVFSVEVRVENQNGGGENYIFPRQRFIRPTVGGQKTTKRR